MKYIFPLLVFITSFSFGQIHVQRSSINSFGKVIKKENLRLSQSAGQSSVIGYLESKKSGVRQGFQQPISNTQIQNTITVNLYPNPNNGQFTLQSDKSIEGPITIELMDSQGRICYNSTYPSGRVFSIKILQRLENGLYSLKVSNNRLLTTTKLVIHTQ
jgi:hypothetical protein